MRFLLSLFLVACLDAPSVPTPPVESCEAEVCEYVSECAPLTTGAWDWRSESACLDTFECGTRPEACWKAVVALPCLPENPRWEDIEEHTRAMVVVRENCR